MNHKLLIQTSCSEEIEFEDVQCPMNQMKIGKTNGPSWFALELFKAGKDKCLKSLGNIFNDILFENNYQRNGC